MKVCICGAGAIGDAKLASMRDLGPVMGAATPTIDMILALVQQRAKIAGSTAEPLPIARKADAEASPLLRRRLKRRGTDRPKIRQEQPEEMS